MRKHERALVSTFVFISKTVGTDDYLGKKN